MGRFVGFLGVFLLAATGAFAQETYPAWFWNPQPSGWTAVFARSDQEALQAAAQVLTAYGQCEVLGNFQQLYDETIDDRSWQNTDYHYLYDDASAQNLRSRLEIKDQMPVVLILGQSLYLVGPPGDSKVADLTRVSAADQPRPGWADLVGAFDGAQGRWRGVGRFTLQGNPADAWIKAEELAVFHMLQARLVEWGHTIQVTTDGSGESSSHVEWIRLSYLLDHVQVDGRWIDPENNLAMVAVSAPKDSIREKS